MLILSWDVGIKNLSYCLIDYKNNNYDILRWENMDISLDENKKCEFNNKNNSICNKNSVYFNFKTNLYYCKKHYKDNKDNENIVEIKSKKCIYMNCKLNKKFICKNGLIGYCKKHKDIYEGIDELYEKKDRSELEMISEKLVSELDNRNYLLECDTVLIENQPAMKNPKMKSIQMIIYSYFLIRGKVDKKIKKISFMLASNKLKIKIDNKENIEKAIIEKHKNKYKQRKELSKIYCKNMINNLEIENKDKWFNYFNINKKQDDLADTFLMIIYFIDNKIFK